MRSILVYFGPQSRRHLCTWSPREQEVQEFARCRPKLRRVPSVWLPAANGPDRGSVSISEPNNHDKPKRSYVEYPSKLCPHGILESSDSDFAIPYLGAPKTT